jgi:hypothetical protein
MRDLLDLIQILSEGVGKLSPGEFKNRPKRFETFINKITNGEPFTTIDNKEVVIDPSEAQRFMSIWDPKLVQFTDKSAQIAKLANEYTYNGNNTIQLSNLMKTSEFGGAGVAVGADPSTGGKASYAVKPQDIGICDRLIPASDLYDVIAKNSVLQSTDYGQIVINLANYIVSGEAVVLPPEAAKNSKLRAAIQDNAGEYLGVLALLYNRSRFPRREQFEEWLGGSLGELTLEFTASETENLADSFASVVNNKTQHKVNISSKGKDGGAAPAISGLKVPEHMYKNPKLKTGLAFVDMNKAKGVIEQTFNIMDLLYNANPKAIDSSWKPFLPWSSNTKGKQGVINAFRTGGNLPASYKKISNKVASKEANDGGKFLYAMKEEIVDAINNKEALPEFKAMVLELLEMNFVQQYVDYEKKHKNELTFATQWPAKLDGKVSVEHKSSAKDPGNGGFSFKLGRTDDSVSSEPGEVEVDDAPEYFAPKGDNSSGKKFKKAAAELVRENRVVKPKETAPRKKRK